MSTVSPLLFSVNIRNFFFADITSDDMNYEEDSTPPECDQHSDNLIGNLELTVDKTQLAWV